MRAPEKGPCLHDGVQAGFGVLTAEQPTLEGSRHEALDLVGEAGFHEPPFVHPQAVCEHADLLVGPVDDVEV